MEHGYHPVPMGGPVVPADGHRSPVNGHASEHAGHASFAPPFHQAPFLPPQPFQNPMLPPNGSHPQPPQWPHQIPWNGPPLHAPVPNLNLNMPMPPHMNPQFMFDAFNVPVTQDEEYILVDALVSSRTNGRTYKDALDTLNMKNNHSSLLWMLYFLEHHHHIEKIVLSRIEASKPDPTQDPPRPSIKKPKLDHLTPQSTPKPSAPRLAQPSKRLGRPSKPQPSKPRPSRKASSASIMSGITPTSGRRTLNSLTAPSPVYNERLPPSHREIQIPDPPSREPSPPTNIVVLARGNKFTTEDRDFFIKYISWRLNEDSSLTRTELCTELGEKAPHHSYSSWGAYWQNHHDLPDLILARARGEVEVSESSDEGSVSSRDKRQVRRHREPNYRESSTDGEEGDEFESVLTSISDEEDDDIALPDWKESDMGQKGEPYTDADFGFVASYIASHTERDWDRLGSNNRWQQFSSKFAQRSHSAWGEFYRRHESTLKKLAGKIRRLRQDGQNIPKLPLPSPLILSSASSINRPNAVTNGKRKISEDP